MRESLAEPRADGPTNPTLLDAGVHEQWTETATHLTTSLQPRPETAKLPGAAFPLHPELLSKGSVESVIGQPHVPPARRHWTAPYIFRAMRGWLFPYIESRLLPGEFHPIICYLFTEYKCNHRVVKWVGRQALRGFQGLTGSFE